MSESAAEVHATAVVTTKPASRDRVRAVYAHLVPATLAEDGCLAYDAYESSTVPGVFVVDERWRSVEHLQAHSISTHMADAISALQPHLIGDISVHALDPVTDH